jgi:hypothetical protein
MSETFHSVINKYAPKRIHFAKSHKSRIAAAALDWTEGMDREFWQRGKGRLHVLQSENELPEEIFLQRNNTSGKKRLLLRSLMHNCL